MIGLPEIAISLHALPASGANPIRSNIETIAGLGVRAIALDAAIDGLRPRQLSRSARRDLAAILRREQLELSTIDLWIPPQHFTAASASQRAFDATTQALGLAAELAPLVSARSRPIVSLTLPEDESIRTELAFQAQHLGALIADHSIHSQTPQPSPGIGIGIDPVFYLADARSPAKGVTSAGDALASARLSDTNAIGRCPINAPGAKLDLAAYAGALIVSGQPWVTLDLRDLPEPFSAARTAIDAWHRAGSI